MHQFAVLFLWLFLATPAWADSTLDNVVARKTIRCGVTQNIPGMAWQDAQGHWAGMDIDFCRALAAAVLGDADTAKFVPLSARARFSSLLSNEIDVLSRNTSTTLGRESQLGVLFTSPLFLTGQAFLIHTNDAEKGILALSNATIGVIKGTTHVQNLQEVAATHHLQFTPVPYESVDHAVRGFLAGECTVLTEDATTLAAIRLLLPSGSPAVSLLPGLHSREIIAPAVKQDDLKWYLIVKAVLSALVLAEECHLTGEAMRSAQAPANNDAALFFLNRADELAKALGLTPGWAVRAIAAAGNYGEMFERNLGPQGPLKLERGLNRLVRDGGLIFTPPF